MLPEGPPVGEGAAPLHLRRSLVRLRRTRLRRESAISPSTSTASLPNREPMRRSVPLAVDGAAGTIKIDLAVAAAAPNRVLRVLVDTGSA